MPRDIDTLIDLTRAIPDEEFADSNHLTVQGQKKFRGLIIGDIVGHLQKIKAQMEGEQF